MLMKISMTLTTLDDVYTVAATLLAVSEELTRIGDEIMKVGEVSTGTHTIKDHYDQIVGSITIIE